MKQDELVGLEEQAQQRANKIQLEAANVARKQQETDALHTPEARKQVGCKRLSPVVGNIPFCS